MSTLFDKIQSSPKPFVIAEIGVNYYDIAKQKNLSLIDAAKFMIDEAQRGTCDAVKFQSYKADKIASKHSPAYWDTSKETATSQHTLFQRYDKFGFEEYKELAQYCQSKDICFLSTPFDFEAADYLDELMPMYKVSSSDLNNLPFISYIAKKSKPILLSTGAATIDEIAQTINVLRDSGCKKVSVMHCVLSYPTKNSDAHIGMLLHLKEKFPDLLLGYSDHTVPEPSMSALTLAFTLGAKVIEKHFTTDKSLSGNDHYHAGNADDFRRFRENSELILEFWGSSIKEPLACEENSRKFARRSLVLKDDLSKGSVLELASLTFKRPGTGIPPTEIDNVVGKRLVKDLSQDTVLSWDDLEAV